MQFRIDYQRPDRWRVIDELRQTEIYPMVLLEVQSRLVVRNNHGWLECKGHLHKLVDGTAVIRAEDDG